jgi:hypothetical protein
LVRHHEIDEIGPDFGVHNIGGARVTCEAAYGFEGRGLARTTTADDAIEVGAEMDPLVAQESAVHSEGSHHRNASRDIFFDANPCVAVLEREFQRLKGNVLHLVARDLAIPGGISAQRVEAMRIGVEQSGEILVLAKAQRFDPLPAEKLPVTVRVEIGVRYRAVAALEFDPKQCRMADDVFLVGRASREFRFQALTAVDMREDRETASLFDEVENIDEAGRAARVRHAAIRQREFGMKPVQCIERGEIAEKMAMRRRELHCGDDEQTSALCGFKCRSDPRNFIMISDRNEVQAL